MFIVEIKFLNNKQEIKTSDLRAKVKGLSFQRHCTVSSYSTPSKLGPSVEQCISFSSGTRRAL
jgi:hypothetical protein